MSLKSTKEHFLTNHVTSQHAEVHYNQNIFVIMLGEKLEYAGCKTNYESE